MPRHSRPGNSNIYKTMNNADNTQYSDYINKQAQEYLSCFVKQAYWGEKYVNKAKDKLRSKLKGHMDKRKKGKNVLSGLADAYGKMRYSKGDGNAARRQKLINSSSIASFLPGGR